MDSPVRKMQKRNDYNRHKLLRKIRRQRRAQVEQQKVAAEKELKRRLRVTPPKFGDGKEPTLLDADKVRMNEQGLFQDEYGNIVGDSVVLPELTVRAHKGYKSAYDREMLDNTIGTALDFTPGIGDAKQGAEALDALNKGNYKEAMMLGGLLALPNVIEKPLKYAGKVYSNFLRKVSPAYDFYKTVDDAKINKQKYLNEQMLKALSFFGPKRSSKNRQVLGDVIDLGYGLPKGISLKTPLDAIDDKQMYDIVINDMRRQNPNGYNFGLNKSAGDEMYIHMDTNSSIIPTTEGFLPTREGFTKVGRYGTPEIWYNKNMPYFPTRLTDTPRTIVTTRKKLNLEDMGFEDVAHKSGVLKYDDILFGLEPNEFGWYNKVKYVPYKKPKVR